MNKLSQVFDFQRFQHNERLESIISDVENRYAHALTDGDLEQVNAAGTADQITDKSLMITPDNGNDESSERMFPQGR